MPSERFDFPNANGERLAALLDRPDGEASAYALFAHCFTCGKDILAAKRIAERLTAEGIAVLRFDFTGLGASEGEFANTTFSSNVADLVAAADELRRRFRAPAILIGHSLGGAAVLAAAAAVPEARAVVTIAAPSDPGHVTHLFKESVDDIHAKGEVEVALAGRPFRIRREFLDDVAEQRLTECVANLRKALLIFHSPTDDLVGIDNATRIFGAAKHPKSFVSLAGADHLLSRKGDAVYVGSVIAAWAERYLDMAPIPDIAPAGLEGVVVTETRQGKFQQVIQAGHHRLIADEPVAVGGLDSGPSPYALLMAALGACTSMTLRLYAEHKKLPLDRVSVMLKHDKIHAADCESCETKEGKIDRIDRIITLEGALDAEQRASLLKIADKCPVHRTLESEIDVRTVEAGAPNRYHCPSTGDFGRNRVAGEFANKIVVVSGGSRGIGRAIAEAFAREGAQTVIAAVSADNLAKAAEAVAKVGPKPVTVAADLRTLEACQQVFSTVKDRFGRCDILVNNAGATRAGSFLDIPDDAWSDGFALKFFACMRLSRAFWPMLKEAHGHVLNIIGGAARTPSSEFLIGGSVNSAMANFSKGLSMLGKRDDVNVNVIHPGMTETDRITTLWRQTAAATGKTFEEVRAETVAKSGVRGIAQPEDVAALALFLCSERARQIQGVAVGVDGGGTPGLY